MGDSINKWDEILEQQMIDENNNPDTSGEIGSSGNAAESGISEKLTIKVFEKEYPELSKEFKQIQIEMYAMFAAKHMDYGLNNIALGGDIVNNSDDKQFSLTGLCIRLTDKISRLKNLLINGRSFVVGEGMEDTFIDIANYGIIGLLVGRNKWKK